MVGVYSGGAGEGKKSFDLLFGIALCEGFLLPGIQRLMFDRGACGPAEVSIRMREVRPGRLNRGVILPTVECFELVPLLGGFGYGNVRF